MEKSFTGVDVYSDMVVENDDPASGAGKQVVLRGANLDSVILTKLDADSDDPLDEDVDFTFEDWAYLDQFHALKG